VGNHDVDIEEFPIGQFEKTYGPTKEADSHLPGKAPQTESKRPVEHLGIGPHHGCGRLLL
jgi:hypothetical protein